MMKVWGVALRGSIAGTMENMETTGLGHDGRLHAV